MQNQAYCLNMLGIGPKVEILNSHWHTWSLCKFWALNNLPHPLIFNTKYASQSQCLQANISPQARRLCKGRTFLDTSTTGQHGFGQGNSRQPATFSATDLSRLTQDQGCQKCQQFHHSHPEYFTCDFTMVRHGGVPDACTRQMQKTYKYSPI